MEDDRSRPRETRKRRRRRSFAAGLAVAGLLVTLGLLAAACGGGSKDPVAAIASTRIPSTTEPPFHAASTSTSLARSGGASTSAGTTVAPSGSSHSSSSTKSRQGELLQFSQCMRSHGIPNFPDLSATKGILNGLAHSGVNTQTPAFQSALQACKKYNTGGLTPAQSAAQNEKGVEESQCMRSHGVPNFPDPTTGPLGEQAINLHGTGIDPQSPTYQAASQACQKLYPGVK